MAINFFTHKISVGLLAGALMATGADQASARNAYCHDFARHEAVNYSDGGDVIASTIFSTITGALIGAAVDGGRGAGRGAAIGAGAGLFGGAINHGTRQRRIYRQAYRACLNNQRARYAAPRAYQPRTVAGRGDRNRYCAAKYRSYNPRTGRYLAYSGQYRVCR